MKFKVVHTFRGVTLDEYEKLFFDEEFNIALCSAVKLARTLVSDDRDETGVKRVVRVGPEREVPKPVAKVLKSDRIEYEEHNEYKWGAYRGKWKTIPSVLASKVKTDGSYTFEAAGDSVRRTVDGDIQVKVLGVGGVIERFIVADVERSYEDAARFTQQWIDDGKHRKEG